MSTERADDNAKIGKRLKEARLGMKLSRAEVADVLCVSSEHYRKLEAGSTGISVDKLLILYHTYGIDPTYLITGVNSDEKSSTWSIIWLTARRRREAGSLTRCLRLYRRCLAETAVWQHACYMRYTILPVIIYACFGYN